MIEFRSGVLPYRASPDAETRRQGQVCRFLAKDLTRRMFRSEATRRRGGDASPGLSGELCHAAARYGRDLNLDVFKSTLDRVGRAWGAECEARAALVRTYYADARRQPRMRRRPAPCRVPRRRRGVGLRSGRPARRSHSRSAAEPPGGEPDPAACVGLHAGSALEAFLVERLLRSAARVGLPVGEYALRVVEVGDWDEPTDLVDFLGAALCAVEVSA